VVGRAQWWCGVLGVWGVRSKFGFARMAFRGERNPRQFRLGGEVCTGKEVERLIGVRSRNAGEQEQEQEGDRVSQTEQIGVY
jgi:hypothetical protein